jgi:Fur family transcriptional regulator, ferric uptake regulator
MNVETKRAGRMTRQRRIVMQILEESQAHLDADSIHALARARDEKISLATVYRALALFKQRGLIEEQRLGEGHGHFEKAQDTPHYHFTCSQCGRVIELEDHQVLELARRLFTDQGLQVETIQLLVSGRCGECQENQA